MTNINRIIVALSDNDLHLKLMCNAGEDKADIYKLYTQFTGNLIVPTPLDEYYVMDSNGEIVFIGNLKLLSNFVNRFTYNMNKFTSK